MNGFGCCMRQLETVKDWTFTGSVKQCERDDDMWLCLRRASL